MQKTEKGLTVTLVTKDPDDKDAQEKLDTIHEVDCLLWAIGREPNTAGLNLSQIVKIYFNLINIIVVVFSINMIGKIFVKIIIKYLRNLKWSRITKLHLWHDVAFWKKKTL